MTIGIAVGVGMSIGLLAGAGLVRYGMGLAERVMYGAKDNAPSLTRYDRPLEQASTADDDDQEID